MTETSKEILDRIRATAKIKNNPAEYQRMGTWNSTTVMHKKTSVRTSADDPGYDSFVFHDDPEINAEARKFVKENAGSSSWQVHGCVYADFSYKIRKLEEAVGILVNEPKKEVIEKSTILKEAYKKYKFVEKMVLGK